MARDNGPLFVGRLYLVTTEQTEHQTSSVSTSSQNEVHRIPQFWHYILWWIHNIHSLLCRKHLLSISGGGGTFLNAHPKQCFHRFLKCESSNLCFQQGRSSIRPLKKISHVGHCHCQNWGPLLMRWAGDSKVGWCKDGLLCSAPAPRHGPLAAGPGRHMLVTLYNYIQY